MKKTILLFSVLVLGLILFSCANEDDGFTSDSMNQSEVKISNFKTCKEGQVYGKNVCVKGKLVPKSNVVLGNCRNCPKSDSGSFNKGNDTYNK